MKSEDLTPIAQHCSFSETMSTQKRGSAVRWTLDQYHAMVDHGILRNGDPVEFLQGELVLKKTKNSSQTAAVRKLVRLLSALVGTLFDVHSQDPITLTDSEPEPDVSVVAHDDADYSHGHPTTNQTALIVEVSDSTLATDRDQKKRIYARARIPEYWIVNLVDKQIEVYSGPKSNGLQPDYQQPQIYVPGQAVPVVLRGAPRGFIDVSQVLPE